jgi:hypothetical protein
MPASDPPALVLDATHIVATLEKLRERVSERFPKSGLSKLCGKLVMTGRATAAQADALARPYLALRALGALVAIVALAVQIELASHIDWSAIRRSADVLSMSQALDATVNLLILAFGGLWFMLTLEQRLKRRRILRALYELRSYAHVVDMHQLTKDPTVVLGGGGVATSSSPVRKMTEFELSRYLDYCSEMLALIAKLAALYAARTQDETIIEAVNDLEDLTSNLGRKIWQKIMIISQLDERRAPCLLPAP